MLILIVINIFIIGIIYLRYYNQSQKQYSTKEEIKEINPIKLGYINDRGFNNTYDLILAEIVNLNIKGYIKIEYDKNDISGYNYTIKQNLEVDLNDIEKHEIIILNFLFSKKMEISRNELEEKLINTFNSYNVQYNDLQEVLQKELIQKYIIDEYKDKELQKVTKIYQRISMLIIIIVLIIKIFIFTEISSISILIYIFEKIISNMLIIKASNYTEKGEMLRNSIIEYKNNIKNKEFLVDKNTMNQVILEKEFANSMALHIKTQAKSAFIDDRITKDATKKLGKITFKTVIVLIIIIAVSVILQKITKSITKDGIVWLYTMLAILIAFAADVTKILGTSKIIKRKGE